VGLQAGEKVASLHPHVFETLCCRILRTIVPNKRLVSIAKGCTTIELKVAGRRNLSIRVGENEIVWEGERECVSI